MNIRLPVLAAILALLVAGCANKQQTPGPQDGPGEGPPPPHGHPGPGHHGPGGAPPPQFSELDANGDGQLSQDEVDEEHWERVLEADSDGDKQVSEAEFNEHAKQRRPPHHEKD